MIAPDVTREQARAMPFEALVELVKKTGAYGDGGAAEYVARVLRGETSEQPTAAELGIVAPGWGEDLDLA